MMKKTCPTGTGTGRVTGRAMYFLCPTGRGTGTYTGKSDHEFNAIFAFSRFCGILPVNVPVIYRYNNRRRCRLPVSVPVFGPVRIAPTGTNTGTDTGTEK